MDISNKRINSWRDQQAENLNHIQSPESNRKKPLDILDEELIDNIITHRRNVSEPQLPSKKVLNLESYDKSNEISRVGSIEKYTTVFSNVLGNHKDERAMNFEKLMKVIEEDKNEKFELFQAVIGNEKKYKELAI